MLTPYYKTITSRTNHSREQDALKEEAFFSQMFLSSFV